MKGQEGDGDALDEGWTAWRTHAPSINEEVFQLAAPDVLTGALYRAEIEVTVTVGGRQVSKTFEIKWPLNC